MSYIIYCHTNLINNKKYIGLTKQEPNTRWQNGNGYKYCRLFYNAIKKYGWSNFKHEIIEDGIETLEQANERETYWISYYHTWAGDTECHGYNLTEGGSANNVRVTITNGIETIIVTRSELNSKYSNWRELTDEEKYLRWKKNTKAKRKVWRKENKEQVNLEQRLYRSKHKELVSEQNKRYHSKHKEYDNKRCRDYCRKNADKRNYIKWCVRHNISQNNTTWEFWKAKQKEAKEKNCKKRFTNKELNDIILLEDKRGSNLCQQEDA